MMNTTGITRQLDDCGRIVLPETVRKKLGITANSHLDLWVRDEKIHIMKHKQGGELNGSIHQIDELGRMAVGSVMGLANLKKADPVDFYTDEETGVIMLQKHDPCCDLCGSLENLKPFKDRKICLKCAKAIVETLITPES